MDNVRISKKGRPIKSLRLQYISTLCRNASPSSPNPLIYYLLAPYAGEAGGEALVKVVKEDINNETAFCKMAKKTAF